MLAFIGRSNVGKSSLLNALIGKKGGSAASVSPVPGHTQSLYFFRFGKYTSNLHTWVDMPGYGFAQAEENVKASFNILLREFLKTSSKERLLKKLFLLIDGRHGIKLIDKEFIAFLEE